MSDKETLYLVDASGFIFRAFHALPPLTNPQGVPVGAVLGFTNMMIRLLKDLQAKHVGVIFDAARHNFRNAIYDQYKANRSETPEDLIPQFPLIRDATRAFGFEPIELDGFEADDLIAAYAREATARGQKVVIVSSDKDLMQLIRDGVTMFDPLKQKTLGPAEVMEKFGVTPDKVVDVQALCGDATDNVPGVRGIGPKTAAELINAYGNLENLLDNLGEIKQPKRRDMLTEHAELARISKKLVRLDDMAPLPKPIDDMGAGRIDNADLIEFLRGHGFRSILTRLGDKAVPAAPVSFAPPPVRAVSAAPEAPKSISYVTITDAATLQAWVQAATEAGIVAIDTETTSLTPSKADLVGVSLCYEAGHAAYIPLGHRAPLGDLLGGQGETPVQMPMEEALRILKPLLENPAVLKIGQNIKYDLQMFSLRGIDTVSIDDTMLLSYALDGTTHGHGMDELAELHLGHTTIKYSDVTGKGAKQISFAEVAVDAATAYAAEDADITLRLHQLLKPRLALEHKATVYETMDRPLGPVIARMEQHGVKVDVNVLRVLSAEFGGKMVSLEAEIHKLAGHPFNVGSPKQLGDVLFGEMGLEGGGKTKKGDWSTSADVLEDLSEHDIVAKVLEWRQMSKLKSTYTDALQQEINPRTGRVHTSFAMAHTSTGRLASSDPNLQNIPIRTEEGRKIRQAFVADAGNVILSIDYSQIELRLAAAMAGIPALQKAFKDGEDIHALTASEVFGVPMAEMTSDIRRKAKAINFGIIYGISGWGLARQLGIDPQEANAFIKQYFSRFPELLDYMTRMKDLARKQGYVETLFGRMCTIDGIADKNGARRSFAERQAINAPLQGTASDIMRKAMIRVDRALQDSPLDCRMLLQVHDELVFEVKAEHAEEAATLIKGIMESIADIGGGVPLVAEAGTAKDWAHAH